ncbi:uncharacterized protein Z519_11378 [Cladophialophora bantiana CBS 173.52]|uniref:Uncharacterized protein n=1 Tax=Cladophialophora bantiana (strain ATCC 10958 / CBS 173.52 / CDC B-1940 / NIH 8579) TaxID=1442370 RepID=A0A0D2FNI6_CLAB1|nr:uncharacterized protein Z519_11378 [Cladophialophora bantiana CBS 173.52]KIW88267.1 hypothetical protein Z519_11378 [Cladophialophora bantiana CBS 173.52]
MEIKGKWIDVIGFPTLLDFDLLILGSATPVIEDSKKAGQGRAAPYEAGQLGRFGHSARQMFFDGPLAPMATLENNSKTT